MYAAHLGPTPGGRRRARGFGRSLGAPPARLGWRGVVVMRVIVMVMVPLVTV